ncbi:STM4015 family protein [Microcoleus sp. FACHB-831]|uniref:STM4015 family protein n=1 Tax=Microcoleus sp. FACHB-831 TaxID=2692827 RepID=UPI001683D578|nr:STM4015 family protein [Microcoleus sp. FACHB-831]MBD1920740.1 STM4015 family protein [Microcoleus sp. FACHB-831]
MNNNPNQPREDDAVLGGQAPPPVGGVILGGLEGVKNRLASSVVEARIAALSEALKYGEPGLELVIAALNDNSAQVHRRAFMLLRERPELNVKQALQQYRTWNLVERLEAAIGDRASKFANRRVKHFSPQTGITNPFGIAYFLGSDWNETEDITIKLERLVQDSQAGQVEALVFGMWNGNVAVDGSSKILVDALVAAKKRLANLKAVFIGDIPQEESEISWIQQSDISPILEAYPNLEVLQVRGGEGLAFSPVKHENLEALIVETGGLSRETVTQICALDLPALEHLELWLGSDGYGGNSSIEDIMPIISGELFPHLTYLGLRNSTYSDEIALWIARSPLMEHLKVLDLSMGTLSDNGALALLNCPAVNRLDILNVADNFLSEETVEWLSELDIQAIANDQKEEYDEEEYGYSRYCSVAE